MPMWWHQFDRRAPQRWLLSGMLMIKVSLHPRKVVADFSGRAEHSAGDGRRSGSGRWSEYPPWWLPRLRWPKHRRGTKPGTETSRASGNCLRGWGTKQPLCWARRRCTWTHQPTRILLGWWTEKSASCPLLRRRTNNIHRTRWRWLLRLLRAGWWGIKHAKTLSTRYTNLEWLNN